MNEMSDWTERVERITAPSVREQLQTLVREAEQQLEKFTETTSEQGGLLLDAQREMEVTFERRIAEFSRDIFERLASVEQAQKRVESRVNAALLSADERFASILRQLERTVGMEDRAAARMVDLLASAFADLRRPPLAAVES